MITIRDPNNAPPPRQAPASLKQALHAHIKSIADSEFTPKMLIELEQAAALAHKMLLVSGEPRALRRGRQHGGGLMGMDIGDVVGPDEMAGGIPGAAYDPLGGPLSPALAPLGGLENFGVEAIRDMVAGIKAPKLNELFQALESAEHLLKNNPDSPVYTPMVNTLRTRVQEALAADETTQHPSASPEKLFTGVEFDALNGGSS